MNSFLSCFWVMFCRWYRYIFLLCILLCMCMMLVFFDVIKVILNLWKKLFSVENDLFCFLWIFSENIR